ncbi:hypothetical protein I6N95_04220 [Vagococcus sp. BWB3-3]|uniref:Mor transcription activator domain-containing protein n=1 Tax=Vagococcus allomyrinae TaxID=2794353 RepID=A0A940SVD0_9ENTE|nr:CD3324 family protein [Vagococcus allomyrinae]MBP1040213.1 hypothetical protein [Vagococcus allomyrinae]
MKYVKAHDVFPKELLTEIQKHVQGQLVYIPKLPEAHEKWGTHTDTKKRLLERNSAIIKAYQSGLTVPQLAESYFLSEETIKKIVYC